MSRSSIVEDYSVRSITNGYVVMFGQDIGRGSMPKEHFVSTPADLGKFIAARVVAVEAERKAALQQRLDQ